MKKLFFFPLLFLIVISGCTTYDVPQTYEDVVLPRKTEAVVETQVKTEFETPTAVETETETKIKTKQETKSVPLSNDNYYTNVDGNKVHSPAYAPSRPAGASARCRDGTYSFSQNRRGTCSHHGGVAEWY